MSEACTLIELLHELGGVQAEVRRSDGTVAAAVLVLPADRRVLTVERTYREGIKILLDPTPEELAIAREGDLWELWNSERCSLLAGAL